MSKNIKKIQAQLNTGKLQDNGTKVTQQTKKEREEPTGLNTWTKEERVNKPGGL